MPAARLRAMADAPPPLAATADAPMEPIVKSRSRDDMLAENVIGTLKRVRCCSLARALFTCPLQSEVPAGRHAAPRPGCAATRIPPAQRTRSAVVLTHLRVPAQTLGTGRTLYGMAVTSVATLYAGESAGSNGLSAWCRPHQQRQRQRPQ